MGMKDGKTAFRTIDEYIRLFPGEVQGTLRQLRKAIQSAAPDAEEAISYQIPTFRLKGNLVHFAAYKEHIGFYPTSSGIRAFRKDLSTYKCSTGTVQFPIDEPLPYRLIKKIVKFRVAENLERDREKSGIGQKVRRTSEARRTFRRLKG
jgi:uncharacterized protein YdhG (YjbR/CyaY superfamily)